MIVLCGPPRSGTTLLYGMLRMTVTSHHVPDRERKALNNLTPDRVITKTPFDCIRIPEIKHRLGPDVTFIVMIRDPRDILVSRHHLAPDEYWVHWDYSLGYRRKERRLTYLNPGLLECLRAIEDPPRSVFVRYESLVREPDEVQTALQLQIPALQMRGCFSDWNHRTKVPKSLRKPLNGVRAPNMRRVGVWRYHPGRILQQFQACPELFWWLRYLGYEAGHAWIKDT